MRETDAILKNPGKKMNALFLLMVVLYLAAAAALSMLSFWNITIPVPWQLVLSELIVLVPGLCLLLWYRLDIAEWIPFRRVSGATVGFSFLLSLLLMPALNFLNVLSQVFEKNMAVDLFSKLDGMPDFALVLVVGLIGPFCEELVFRGILYHGYRMTNRVIGAMLLTGLLFGLFHLNLNQFGYAMLLGIVSAALLEGTGSIFPSLILHGTINTYNVLMVLFVEKLQKAFGRDLSEMLEASRNMDRRFFLVYAVLLLAPAFGGMIVVTLLYRAILRREGRLEAVERLLPWKRKRMAPETLAALEATEEVKQPLFSATGIIGIAICATMMFALPRLLTLFAEGF